MQYYPTYCKHNKAPGNISHLIYNRKISGKNLTPLTCQLTSTHYITINLSKVTKHRLLDHDWN